MQLLVSNLFIFADEKFLQFENCYFIFGTIDGDWFGSDLGSECTPLF